MAGAEIAALAGTDPNGGLGPDEAARRLAAAGPNEVAHRTGTPVWRLVAGQLTDTMILVLLASAALTAAVGDLTDMAVILAVIAVNTTLGVVQEVRAGRAIAALGTLTAPQARPPASGRPGSGRGSRPGPPGCCAACGSPPSTAGCSWLLRPADRRSCR